MRTGRREHGEAKRKDCAKENSAHFGQFKEPEKRRGVNPRNWSLPSNLWARQTERKPEVLKKKGKNATRKL